MTNFSGLFTMRQKDKPVPLFPPYYRKIVHKVENFKLTHHPSHFTSKNKWSEF